MTNNELIRIFLQAENTYEGKIVKSAQEGNNLIVVFKRMWDSVVLISDDKSGFRVKVSYLYDNDPNIVFAPENSNFDQALKMSQRVIHQLKKKGQLKVF